MGETMARILMLLSLSVILSGCELIEWKDKLLATVVDQIPMSFEEKIGAQLLPSILPADMILKDPGAQASLESLLEPLTSSVNAPVIKIHISKDSALNAFATPGGHLIFNRGMLLAAESPDEILGVAAHEIAHATERHSMRSMVQGLSIFAIVAFFFGDLEGLGAYIRSRSIEIERLFIALISRNFTNSRRVLLYGLICRRNAGNS